MALEIERKFLVLSEEWRILATQSIPMKQGYLTQSGDRSTVRLRLAGEAAYLTIKSRGTGISRSEYEYSIPIADALEMMRLCSAPVEKVRCQVPYEGKVWEIDVFSGANAGLTVAEIELASESEAFTLPPWIGREVSEDPKYRNSNLATAPYSTWTH